MVISFVARGSSSNNRDGLFGIFEIDYIDMIARNLPRFFGVFVAQGTVRGCAAKALPDAPHRLRVD